MFLDQLMLINGNQLSFFDNELAAYDRVIRIDGLTKDNRGNGVVHACITNSIKIHSEEVGALASFQAANIVSSQDCRSPARGKIQRFAGSH
jgi:hypothetical protein